MKAYTDLEQSKKLAEILPLESADMHYNDWSYDFLEGYEHTGRYKVDLGTPKTICGELDIPCWSLAALINVLPTTIGNFFEKNALRLRMDKGVNDFNIWYDNFDCGDVAEGLDVIEDNSVDACYEMILKLHELNLL